MILSYKYRIKDRSAKKTLRQYSVAVNQVWNYCNSIQKESESRFRAGGPRWSWLGEFQLGHLTAGSSRELGLHSGTVSQVCRKFVHSRNMNKGHLRFRSSFGPRRSLGWVPFRERNRKIVGNKITFLGKSYRLFGVSSRPIPLTAKGGEFVEDARGRWYIIFHVEVDESLPAPDRAIGIDLGLKSLAAMSDGTSIPAPKIYRAYEASLKVAQRSRNLPRVRALNAKIANKRRDFMHKVTTKIVSENSTIIVGGVNGSGLMKARMAKSVADIGWGMFKSQIEYKARRRRSVFIVIDESFTSQVCSDCGSLPNSRPIGIADLRIRRWECSDCGASHDRDVNAAKNILSVGLSCKPLAGESRRALRSLSDINEMTTG